MCRLRGPKYFSTLPTNIRVIYALCNASRLSAGPGCLIKYLGSRVENSFVIFEISTLKYS